MIITSIATVRPAREEDIPTIINLHESWFDGESAKGFLLDHGEAGDILSYVREPSKLCLVAETDEGEPAGFIQANRAIECFDRMQWALPEARPVCLRPGHWHVDNVAVNPAFAGCGIGRALYDEVRELGEARSLSAFVVCRPKENVASLAFHRRLGFERAGEFAADLFCGVRDYRSVLLFNGRPGPAF